VYSITIKQYFIITSKTSHHPILCKFLSIWKKIESVISAHESTPPALSPLLTSMGRGPGKTAHFAIVHLRRVQESAMGARPLRLDPAGGAGPRVHAPRGYAARPAPTNTDLKRHKSRALLTSTGAANWPLSAVRWWPSARCSTTPRRRRRPCS
jgi:hypothetical protein